MELMDHMLVAKARTLAERAHAAQVDKVGRPYVEHLTRVAAAVAEHPVSPGLAQAVAWLHDVIEDTELGEVDLMAAGMPRVVVEAVEAITHRPHEPRVDYYLRVQANPLALAVKLADVIDNSDPERLAQLDEATRERADREVRRRLDAAPCHHALRPANHDRRTEMTAGEWMGMTVKDLRDALVDLPDDMPVVVATSEDSTALRILWDAQESMCHYEDGGRRYPVPEEIDAPGGRYTAADAAPAEAVRVLELNPAD